MTHASNFSLGFPQFLCRHQEDLNKLFVVGRQEQRNLKENLKHLWHNGHSTEDSNFISLCCLPLFVGDFFTDCYGYHDFASA